MGILLLEQEGKKKKKDSENELVILCSVLLH